MERFFYIFILWRDNITSPSQQSTNFTCFKSKAMVGVPCSRKSRSATYRRASGSGQRSENLTFLAVRASKEPPRRAARHICNGGASK